MCYQAGNRSRIGAMRRKAAMRLRLIDWDQYVDSDDALMDLCICLDADPDDREDLPRIIADLLDPKDRAARA